MPKEGKQMNSPKKAARPKRKRRAISISRLMALTFLGIIVFGALLLMLPFASRNGRRLLPPPA